MSGIVIELQNELLKSNCDILTALRKAHLIASKLSLTEFDKWIEYELNGYKCEEDEIPDYRIIKGELKGWNPYRGWIPVIFTNGEMEQIVCRRKLPDSICAIIQLRSASTSQRFQINVPADCALEINKMVSNPYPTNYTLMYSIHLLDEIIDKVKNNLLEWTLILEKQGIIGENMVFSDSETSAAKRVSQQTNNYYGPVVNGNIDQSLLAAGNENSISMSINHNSLTDEIRKSLQGEHLSAELLETANELLKDIDTKLEQKKKPTIIKAALIGLKEFLLGVGANVTAGLLITKISGMV